MTDKTARKLVRQAIEAGKPIAYHPDLTHLAVVPGLETAGRRGRPIYVDMRPEETR